MIKVILNKSKNYPKIGKKNNCFSSEFLQIFSLFGYFIPLLLLKFKFRTTLANNKKNGMRNNFFVQFYLSEVTFQHYLLLKLT